MRKGVRVFQLDRWGEQPKRPAIVANSPRIGRRDKNAIECQHATDREFYHSLPDAAHYSGHSHRTNTAIKMDSTDKMKDEASKSEHGAIPLPEHMDRPAKGPGNRPQTTAGGKTPGREGKRDMSEAAERKARRDGAKVEDTK